MLRSRPFLLFLAVLLAAIVLLPACDSAVETAPEQDLPRQGVFNSQASARSVVLGVYERLQFAGAYGGIGYTGADISTSNADFGGSFTTYQSVQNYSIFPTTLPALTIWDDNYELINAANEVVTRVGDVPNISPGAVTGFTAEAKFLRALAYHNLLRWYATPYAEDPEALGVPLALQPTAAPSEELNRSRATVAAVYEQINSDLSDAASGFSQEGIVTSDGGANLYTIRALQARVALYQEDYEAAAEFATAVIESGNYQLIDDVVNLYGTDNTAEDIFAVVNSTTDNSGTNDFPGSFYLQSDLGGRGDITVGNELLAIYNDSLDARQRGLVYAVPNPNAPVPVFGLTDQQCAEVVACFTYKFRSNTFADNIKVLRLAEMYLIRAEAEARQDGGNGDRALSDLNRVRTRAGLPAFESVDDIEDEDDDGSALVDEIVQEHRREFAFEGKYRHLLIRLGRPLSSGDLVAEAYQRIFPIPQEEIDVNSNIQQNPGY